MSAETYIEFVQAIAAHYYSGSRSVGASAQRKGQFAFNLLRQLRPEIAARIGSGPCDPFYQDSRLPEFFVEVAKSWDAPPATEREICKICDRPSAVEADCEAANRDHECRGEDCGSELCWGGNQCEAASVDWREIAIALGHPPGTAHGATGSTEERAG